MTLALYHIPDWASQVIRLALEELDLPHQVMPLDWDASDFDRPGFRAVNPLGLIPALQTPDGPIFETAAILLWLIERHGQLGPGPGQPDRAAFLSWLMFISNTVHATVVALIHPHLPAGAAAAPAAQRLALDRLNAQAAQLEALITTRAPSWLCAGQPGAAGYYLGTILAWALLMPEDPGLRFSLHAFPGLHAVLAAHEASPAARRVALAEGLGPHPFTAPTGAAGTPT